MNRRGFLLGLGAALVGSQFAEADPVAKPFPLPPAPRMWLLGDSMTWGAYRAPCLTPGRANGCGAPRAMNSATYRLGMNDALEEPYRRPTEVDFRQYAEMMVELREREIRENPTFWADSSERDRIPREFGGSRES